MVPEDYETAIVPVEFTRSELDMIYVGLMFATGHPFAESWELTEAGLETMQSVVNKIDDTLPDEPDVLSSGS